MSKLGLVRRTLISAAVILAVAEAACGGKEVAPAVAPASPPVAAPAAAAPASAQSSQTLESVVAQCGTSPKNEVLISVIGKEPLKVPVGNWMSDYSQRVAGVGLPRSGFECVSAVYDDTHKLVFAYGQDKSGFFPAELTVIDVKTGKEVGYVMHPGHIKGVVPVGKMDTPRGNIDVLVVTAVSNLGPLVQQASGATGRAQPYVPVAMAVDLKTMEVIGYLPLGNEGQPLLPTAFLGQNGSLGIRYTLDANGNRTPATFDVGKLFTPPSIGLATNLGRAGAFK